MLAVSGGTTPQRMFDQLSNAQLDWTRVVVTLVDERCVGEDSPRSNAALVRQHLLKGPADFARFVPLYQAGQTPQEARAQAQRVLSTAPASFAAVALGMGLDGHTASFFPGGDRLAQAIDPDTQDRVRNDAGPRRWRAARDIDLADLAAGRSAGSADRRRRQAQDIQRGAGAGPC